MEMERTVGSPTMVIDRGDHVDWFGTLWSVAVAESPGGKGGLIFVDCEKGRKTGGFARWSIVRFDVLGVDGALFHTAKGTNAPSDWREATEDDERT